MTPPTPNPSQRPLIALVAGEDSGDMLGASLATALLQRWPGARLLGMGGPRMRAAGVQCWHDISELSVMGLAEVARHLPRLLRLRRTLAARLLDAQPDMLIGIDAPDFNLGLEKRLKQAGVTTVHYVSPSVWAWRQARAERIGACADRVLCLLPMEPPIYARHGVDARFVGHPLASRFAIEPDRAAARATLELDHEAPVLALLPGSRSSEIERLADIFLTAAERLTVRWPNLEVLLPAANARCGQALRQRIEQRPGSIAARVRLLDGQAHEALVAADVALLASGTVALEAMLAKCPMVVGYRLSPLSYALIRSLKLMKTSWYSLPNVLAGRELVAELMQADCRADKLAAAVAALLAEPQQRQHQREAFARLHQVLAGDEPTQPAARAVAAIADLLEHDAPHG